MSSVSTSIRMYDQMTRPLRQVTNALNLTISSMERMNNIANRDITLSNQFTAARNSIRQAESAFRQLEEQQNNARNRQENLNESIRRGTGESRSLLETFKGIAKAYLTFQTIRKGIDLVIGGAAKLEQQMIVLSGMLGNKEVGKAFFENLNRYANESVYNIKQFNAITRQFIQFSKNTDQLMRLNKTAERLAFLDPTQGLEGAGFALKEALGGDFMSLKGRFGFGKAEKEILKSAKSMDEFIEKFNQILEQKGASEKALEEFNNSAIAQFNNLKSNIEAAFSQAGLGVLNQLKPVLSAMNQAFKEGQFQGFFNVIANGIGLVVDGLFLLGSTIKNIFIFGYQVIQSFIDIFLGISPVVAGVGAAIFAYNAIIAIMEWRTWAVAVAQGALTLVQKGFAFATGIATKAQAMLNLVMSMNPIGIVIALVIGLTTAIIAFGTVTQGIRKIFADAFGYIVDIAQNAVNRVIKIINGAIKAINSVSGFFSNILGTEQKQIKEIQFKADFSKFKSAGQDFIQNATLEDIKAKIGFKIPENTAMQKQNELLKNWNDQQKDNFSLADDSNKKLKKISDSVDISKEDLQVMRELAEMKNIQNFVTLTPTVNVEATSTGGGFDIDTMIARITESLENEIVSSASATIMV